MISVIFFIVLMIPNLFGYNSNGNITPAEAAQAQPTFKVTFEDVDAILKLNKDEVLKDLGFDYEIVIAGAEGLEQGYYYGQYGITLVFEEQAPYKIEHVECNNIVDIKGAKQGMTFKQITILLGKGEQFQVLDGEYMGRYYLTYQMNDVLIQFGAPDLDEPTDELIIRKYNNE